MELRRQAVDNFRVTVWRHYMAHGRHDLPWRRPISHNQFDPYAITVSELMLQQTQVGRVIPKYEAFLHQFPSVAVLASATLGEVIQMWNGLGYNRRAKYLWQSAQLVHHQWQDSFPRNITELVKLPGVGINTAGAIVAYAFNEPAVFVETNIRTAIIHHFFSSKKHISEHEVREVVSQVVDLERPREWYWALMDYGSFVKHSVGNLNMLSNSYMKQSPFQGSRREVRGAVLRRLATAPATASQLRQAMPSVWLPEVLDALLAEELIQRTKSTYHL